MAKFFRFQFGVDGDKTAIPDLTQVSGAVSYQQGWGFDYERPQDGSDPLAKDVPRDETNQLYYDITDAIRQYQTHGIPDFITSADNGSSPYPYTRFARVLYDDGSGIAPYTSLNDANTALPSDSAHWSKGTDGITNLIGDVVADGPGIATATIQPNAVTTVKILAKNVTFAKIQDIPAYSAVVNSTNATGAMGTVALAIKQLLGRGDGTTGIFGAIALGLGLDIVGNTLINTLPGSPGPKVVAAVRFTTNGTIIQQYNVSSVSYPSAGSGLYSLNFTSALANSNYYFTVGYKELNGSGAGSNLGICQLQKPTGGTQSTTVLDLQGYAIQALASGGSPTAPAAIFKFDITEVTVIVYSN